MEEHEADILSMAISAERLARKYDLVLWIPSGKDGIVEIWPLNHFQFTHPDFTSGTTIRVVKKNHTMTVHGIQHEEGDPVDPQYRGRIRDVLGYLKGLDYESQKES